MLSRHASIRHILACIDGTDKDESVLDHALQIALRFDSHIDVLHVRFDAHGTTADKKGQHQVDRLLGGPVEQAAAEAAARAHRHFDQWHDKCRLPLFDSGTAIRGASSLWRKSLDMRAKSSRGWAGSAI